MEMTKVSLPDKAVTSGIANPFGSSINDQGSWDEVKVFYLAAFEGRRRVLWEEHKVTLRSLKIIGGLLRAMGDYEGALAYYQQVLRALEKISYKTLLDTLTTIEGMTIIFLVTENFTKAEEMYRVALGGFV